MALNVALIKQLRDRTGAGMTDCKKLSKKQITISKLLAIG